MTSCTTTIFRRHRPRALVTMFRFSNGYPEAHGKELAVFLKNIEIVGHQVPNHPKPFAMGPGCLAAQMVAHFKQGPGHIYLAECPGEPDYDYLVSIDDDGTVELRVHDSSYDLIFAGSPQDFLEWLKAIKEPVHV